MALTEQQIAQYSTKTPGVYFIEQNNSVVNVPIQTTLNNLVVGFSKKGPVNSPVLLQSSNDLESIFGNIDSNLENKGSFFHRTVLNMLNTSPVWACNLLATDDNRDKLNWQNISVSALYSNNVTKLAPYSMFFNRQDFWKRDADAFADIVTQNNGGIVESDKLLSFTNMGDKTLTTFVFKATVPSMDVYAQDWYGGVSKVPSFMYPKDYISDYMVTVLILAGDWTDYNTLSVDTIFTKYFNSNGLIKSNVSNFINEPSVTILGLYSASLIPNFVDKNNNDLYILNVINNNTNSTGLFCTYNEDELLSEDFPKGKIDLIGNTLVGTDQESVDFISYNDSITETITYAQKYLDSAGNVWGNASAATYASSASTVNTRSKYFSEWYTNDITIATTSTQQNTFKIDTIYSGNTFHVSSPAAISGLTNGDPIYFNKFFTGVVNQTYYVININTGNKTFQIANFVGGTAISGIALGTTTDVFAHTIKMDVTAGGTNPFYTIGAVQYTFATQTLIFDKMLFNNSASTVYRVDVVYLDQSGTAKILRGTESTLSAINPSFNLNIQNTIILGYVTLTYAVGNITLAYSAINMNSTGYIAYTNSDIIITTGTTTSDIYTKLEFAGTSNLVLTDYNSISNLKLYVELAEKLALNKSVIIVPDAATKKFSIVDPLLLDATTDYNASITIYGLANTLLTVDNLVIYYIDDEFLFRATTNTMMTLMESLPLLTGTTYSKVGLVAEYSAFYQDYYNGIINNFDYFLLTDSTKVYIKTFIDSNGILTVQFVGEDKASLIDCTLLTEIDIHSNRGAYKETIEIENFTATNLTNVTSFQVLASRYTSLIVGNMIEAYYDPADYESDGQFFGGIPKKLTRVLSTTISGIYKIVNTDAPIGIYTISSGTSEYQTYRYPTVDEYITEYKGIALSPFKMSADSIPDGTEARQNSILNVIDKSTNLAKALANKNKISWRYLVDSFGLGLTANSKQVLADLCGKKLNCLGFINMPSAKQFKNSTNPSFIDSNYALNFEYVRVGGDLSKSPNFLYSFAGGSSDVDGRSCVAYVFPYVKQTLQGLTKYVPCSSFIATTYMQKFVGNTQGIYPFTVVAGVVQGIVAGVTPEMNFNEDDLTSLNAMGANPITVSPSYGYYINTEYTASMKPISSLSNIHARETLIELENSLYDMLLRYQWKFNIPSIQSEIKFKADRICKNLLSQGAITKFNNVIDSTNNTGTILDLQMGVLETQVWISSALKVIVNKISIQGNTITSTGFNA